jgi:hypothetical protein
MMDDYDKNELKQLRTLEGALRLQRFIGTLTGDTIAMLLIMLSVKEKLYELEDGEIMKRYNEINKQMISGEICWDLLFEQE